MIAALVSRLLFLEHFMKQVEDHTDYENHNDDDDDDILCGLRQMAALLL